MPISETINNVLNILGGIDRLASNHGAMHTTNLTPRSRAAKPDVTWATTASDCGEHSMAFLVESRVMTLVY